MPKPALRRPHHQAIARILKKLDGDFLLASRCFLGGGTCISLLGDEFHESRDIDFLVSDRSGFRALREAVRLDSLGRIAAQKIELAREVRADRDGIRTFALDGEFRIKVELILEGRIDLDGAMAPRFGVPVLSDGCLAAEKLLANADRGADDSMYARDLIDLAFLAVRVGRPALQEGMAIATAAYGASIVRDLGLSLSRIRSRRGRLAECTKALGITDLRTLRAGLAILRPFAKAK